MIEKKLSVIVPAYNVADYIEEAITSAIAQAWDGEKEILVIDDGSTDGTADVAKALGCVVIPKEHGGAAVARNAGIQACEGEFLLFLDADDILLPGAFAALYAPMQADEQVQAVFSKAMDFISPELTAGEMQKIKVREESYHGMLTGCALLRRELFSEVGLFDESLKSAETVDWVVRLRDTSKKTVKIDTVTLKRRLHLHNTGRLAAQQEMKDYAAILRERLRRTSAEGDPERIK